MQTDLPATENAPPSSLPAGVTVMTIRPLYSPGQVAAATFFGGPFGGGWLLAMNYQRLGEPRKARLAVCAGVLAMAVLVAIALVFPKGATWFPTIALVIAMSSIAKRLQGEDYERHVALQGRRGSNWHAIGVGLASLAICVAAIFGVGFGYAMLTEPDQIAFGRSHVRYTGGGTRAEARAVGQALGALGALEPDAAFTIEVRRDHVLHIVAFVVDDAAFSDERLQIEFHELADELSRRAFASEPLDIWLTDAALEPHVKLAWEARPRTLELGDDHTIVYRHGGQKAEAQGVARVLEQHNYFRAGQPGSVIVTRADGTRVVELVVAEDAFEDTEMKTTVHALASEFSTEAFGGQPVDIWLLDEQAQPRVKLTWGTRPR